MLSEKNLSNYELLREKNIEERQSLISALMKDFAEFKQAVQPTKAKPVNTNSKMRSPRKYTRRTTAHFLPYRSPPRTRSRRASVSSSTVSDFTEDFEDEEEEKQPQLIFVKFPFMRYTIEETILSDSDDDIEVFVEDIDLSKRRLRRRSPEFEYQSYKPKRNFGPRGNSILDPNVNILMPEDVTRAMLDNCSDRAGNKTYCQSTGTTCHQCRQKTIDTKTVCRSGECSGVRGMFCGPCLKNRYGEDIREALLDSKWICPPCRELCNCSICRKRMGQTATGILIDVARAKGFDNVKDYLESLMQ